MQNPKKAGEPPWTILKILQWATPYFESRDVENPRASAEILLAHALGLRRIDLYVQYDKPLEPDELAGFKALVRRRIQREPVAYIIGEREFWSMQLKVTPDVLIPRPETELLVEKALEILSETPASSPRKILEMGTGSGAIVLALAAERPDCLFFASDRSPRALAVAQENARRHQPDMKIRFFGGDWFDPLRKGGIFFDLIISNPPYIRRDEIAGLQPEVARYEPLTALDGGPDGLDDLRHIIRAAPEWLVPGGMLLLETGSDQRQDVIRIGEDTGAYDSIRVIRDYAGLDRVAIMRRSGL